MSSPSIYQPLLLRILHGLAGILTIGALITGFWVYDNYDQRWGTLSLPRYVEIQGLHGTIAVIFLVIFTGLALYSFRLGDRRLLQQESLTQITQVGKPIWWFTLHRLSNTVMLLSGTFAIITGRMMKEEWLPKGELEHAPYYAHLIAWVLLFASVAIHALMAAKVGGVPLILSMVQITMRSGDRPKDWLKKFKKKHTDQVINIAEKIIAVGILIGLLIPLFL